MAIGLKRSKMNQKQFEVLLDFFTWYRERGLAPREAFVVALKDYVFIYGTGEEPKGILEVSELEGGDATE